MHRIRYLKALLFLGLIFCLFQPVFQCTSDNFNITVNALDAPTDFSLSVTATTDVQITWTKNIGADTTLIRRKPDSYPTSRTDGTFIYNSSGSSYIDGGVTAGNTYYYYAWSYNATYGIWSSPTGGYIYVQSPALFDIKNIFILDGIIEGLSMVCTVANEGGTDADMVITWILTRLDTGATLDTGGDTFAVTAGDEELYYIYPSTIYIGLCNIFFSGNGASSSRTFTTTELAETPPGAGGGGRDAPPYSKDTDGDGLTDAEEEHYGTDPFDKDTDNDGYSDYAEIQAGTDPLDSKSHPGPKMGIDFFILLAIIIGVSLVLFLFYYRKKEKEKAKA